MKGQLVVGGLVAALVLAGVGLGAQAAGWWDVGGEPVTDPVIVREVFDKPGLQGSLDIDSARTIADPPGTDVSLIAVPKTDGGYCMSISLSSVSDLPVTCADSKEANQGNVFMSWAIAKQGHAPVWVVAGRVNQPGATTVSTQGLSMPVDDEGFYFSIVPGLRWGALSRAAGRISILDAAGKELLASCARMPYSPTDTTFAQNADEVSGTAADFTEPPC